MVFKLVFNRLCFSSGRPNGSSPSERHSDGIRTALQTGPFLVFLFPVRKSVRIHLERPNGIRTVFGRLCKRDVFNLSVSRSQKRSNVPCASERYSDGIRTALQTGCVWSLCFPFARAFDSGLCVRTASVRASGRPLLFCPSLFAKTIYMYLSQGQDDLRFWEA